MSSTDNAVLSEQEKGRILYHMGYGIVNVASLFTLGVPAMSQPLYIAASAIEHIPVTRIQFVREVVARLEDVESKRGEALDFLVANRLGSIEINTSGYMRAIDEMYSYWAHRLSDMLIAPLNPYSDRFTGGGRPMNFRVAGP